MHRRIVKIEPPKGKDISPFHTLSEIVTGRLLFPWTSETEDHRLTISGKRKIR